MTTYTSEECMRIAESFDDPDGRKYWEKKATSIAFNECVNTIWDEQRAERKRLSDWYESAPTSYAKQDWYSDPDRDADGGDG